MNVRRPGGNLRAVFCQLFFEVMTVTRGTIASTFLLPQCSQAGFGFFSYSLINITTTKVFWQSLQMNS